MKLVSFRRPGAGIALCSCMHTHLFEPRSPTMGCSEGNGSSFSVHADRCHLIRSGQYLPPVASVIKFHFLLWQVVTAMVFSPRFNIFQGLFLSCML